MTTQPQPASPAPAPGPAVDPQTRALGNLRAVLAGSLVVLVVLFGIAACWPFLRSIELREGWPWLAWGASLGVVALAGAVVLFLNKQPTPEQELAFLQTLTGIVVLALAVGFITVPIYLVGKDVNAGLANPLAYWAACVAATCVVAGILCLLPPQGSLAPVDGFKILLLFTGAIVGLVTTGLGYALFYTYSEELLKGLENWRANPLALVLPSAAAFGGLVVMFLSLQLARGMERSSPTMRRLIYGYNAVLSALLLISVLGVPNILAYASPFDRFFGRNYDWTSNGFNSLSEDGARFLATLQEPLEVIVLLPPQTQPYPVSQNVQSMLDACKAVTGNVHWRLIDPNLDSPDLDKLQEEYGLTSPVGVLVVDAKDKKKNAFIPRNELFKVSGGNDPFRQESGNYTFTGENAFLNAVASLSEGKVTVYFTQGSGELSLEPSADGQGKNSISTLRNRLQERKNFEVKPLELTPSVKNVPDDADVVVIARPTSPLPAAGLTALRNYLKKPEAKLVALLDPVTQKQGDNRVWVETGVEQILAENGVEVGRDRLATLDPRMRNPVSVLVMANPRSRNPVATTLTKSRSALLLTDVRTVKAAPETRGLQVEPFLIAPFTQYLIDLTDPNKDAAAVVEALRRGKEEDVDKQLLQTSPSVAVFVSTSQNQGMPPDRAHAGLFQEKPRMVVVGNSGWITDQALGGGEVAPLELFSRSLSWVRGRAMTPVRRAPDRERPVYELGVPVTEQRRLYFLPLGLLVLGVVGLGTGVWMVRRR